MEHKRRWSGKAYKTGDKVNMGAANISLYAQWSKAQFTITYHGNGKPGTVPITTTHFYKTDIDIAPPGTMSKVRAYLSMLEY
jgi:hypothetical protein